MTRARQLLDKYPATMVNFIFFTDVKVFTVAAPANSQNDRFYVRSGTRKKDGDENRLLRTRPTFSKSVMVSVGISKLDCTSIHFVEPGVDVNGEYNLIGQKLLPDIRLLSQDEFFSCFNRMAPLHIGHATQSLARSSRHPTSYIRHCGRRIRQILTQLTTVSGVFCRRKFTAPK